MTVEVCPICDIAGCRHIRERKSARVEALQTAACLAAAKDAPIAELERQLAEAREVKPLEALQIAVFLAGAWGMDDMP